MAKKTTSEVLSVDVVINANKAQSELNKLGREITDTTSQIKSLKSEHGQLTKELKISTAEYNKVTKSIASKENSLKLLQVQQQTLIEQGRTETKEYRKLNSEIRITSGDIDILKKKQDGLLLQNEKSTSEIKKLNSEIKKQETNLGVLNSKQDQHISKLSLEEKTTKQLKRELTNLTRLRDQSIPHSDEYTKYASEIDLVSGRLRELQVGSELTGNSIDKLSGRFKGWISTAAAAAVSFTAISLGIRKAVTEYATFDDLLVDVMKTTNLSKDSVKELNRELSEIETRTSQEDLLGLSRIAGKLGYNEISEITEFVKANNQIIVSLNEDLGGNVEETVTKIGKLVDIFKLKDLYSTEEAFLKVGSALNELGMASTANEGYMVEFARRMAGVAPLAKVSIDQILGLGAALDQLGQTEEVSSTALSKLFLKLASEAETYSKYARMSLTDFKDLLEKDFMGAFTKVLEGVKDNANGINELAATLGDLGEDGGRIIGVIGSLANNVDVLTSSMDLANKSMIDGTSITNEYELKNQSAAAKLEMAQKQVKALWIELGEKLWPVITSGLGLFNIFLKVLKSTTDFITNNIKVISALTIALIAYYTATQISAKWEAITTAYMAGKRIVVTSLSIVYNLLTGNITRAAAAQQLLNLRMLANPYGLVAATIIGLTALIVNYVGKLSAAEKAQKAINEVNREAIESTAAQRFEIDRLSKVIRDETKDRSLRLSAIKQLREIMPNVLKDYSDEAIAAGKAANAIKTYTDVLLHESRIKAKKAHVDRIVEENAKYNAPRKDGLLSEIGKVLVGEANYDYFTGRTTQQFEDRVTTLNLALKDLLKTEEDYQKFKDKFKINIVPGSTDDNNTVIPTSDSKADSKLRKAYQTELEDAEKHHQDLLQQKGLFREDLSELDKSQLAELAKYQEEYQAKLDSIHKRYGESLKTVTNTANQELKKRADAEKTYIDSILIKRQTESEAEKSAHQDRLVKAGLFGVARETMTKRQLDALEILEREHSENLAKIDSEAIAKEIDARISANRDIITDLRIRHNEELSEIRTLNEAKQYLSATLSEKELSQIRTLSQARKVIQNQQMLEEQAMMEQQLKDLIETLQRAQASGEFEGLVLSDKILSEEEKKVLIDRIRQLKEEIAKLKGSDKADELTEKAEQDRAKFDILGMSIGDWENLFKNTGDLRERIQQIINVVGALSQVWSQYNALVAAKENAQLQKDEAANNKKKDNLKRRLDDGVISQENYNKLVENMDADMDKKKAKVARDQAKRERNVSLMSAIVNTARGITAAFPNPYLMALVAAIGAIQIGTIAATPLPEIPGAESGGQLMDVIREQDGKKFRAKNKPGKRGFISSPTVIVGENGEEWVANAKAVSNPSISPIFDVLDTAQRNGRISTMTLSDVIAQTMSPRLPARQAGGRIAGGTTGTVTDNNNIENFLIKNMETLKSLDSKLSNLHAKVVLLGKDGFIEKMEEYKQSESNGNF